MVKIKLEGKEERVVEIPIRGSLETVKYGKVRRYANPYDTKPKRRDIFNDKGEQLVSICFNLRDGKEAYLIWVDKRKEWVAVVNNFGSRNEPYSLDDYCKEIIKAVYHVCDTDTLKRDISRTSPSELETLDDIMGF